MRRASVGWFLCLFVAMAGAQLAAAERPNIICILVDDLGGTDLGCYGSTFYETPNIDRLAAQGMKFTTAYSACTVCSPTRAALMTGKYPARLHITDWIPGENRPKTKLKLPDWTKFLDTREVTIARRLKDAGYATACVGKWHLGDAEYYPEKHGFDVNIGGTNKGQPPAYFAPYKIPTLPEGPAGEFLSDRLTAEAVAFIEKNKDRPFFVYLPHYAVHTPIAGKAEVIAKYKQKAKAGMPHNNAAYAALIESVDDSVGSLSAALERLKLTEKTIIVFTSDNGGLKAVTSNVPFRVGKGSAYEGGVRVPLIVRWPGTVAAGSTSETPVITPDLFATFLEAAALTPAPDVPLDGLSLMPLLKQTGTLKRDALFWHYPHYHGGGATPYSAIRAGNLRLVEFFEDDSIQMYDLANDVGETKDLAPTMPEKAAELRAKLAAWRKDVGAQMPTKRE